MGTYEKIIILLIVIGSVQCGEAQVNYWTDVHSSYYGTMLF
jgi:hypothetical protein